VISNSNIVKKHEIKKIYRILFSGNHLIASSPAAKGKSKHAIESCYCTSATMGRDDKGAGAQPQCPATAARKLEERLEIGREKEARGIKLNSLSPA